MTRIAVGVLGCWLMPAGLFAQWTTQTIPLQPGWNAVFLEIQPTPRDCDTLFKGIPVESVWSWNRRFSTAQYIQDPNSLIPGQPDWLVYLPASSPDRAVNNLFTLLTEHAYLVKLSTNASPVSWTITGQPAPRGPAWVPDSFNLCGFHVDPGAPPTFQEFFAGSPAQSGRPMLRLSSGGAWVPVNPASDRISPGVAYWIQSAGFSTYAGPLQIVFAQGRSIDYGLSLTEQTFTLQNTSTAARTVTIAQSPSLPPPGGVAPLAGPVPLSYWRTVLPTNFGFQPLTGPLTNTIPAGGSWAIRLAVRRPDMAPPPNNPGPIEPMYESLLQVSDGAGTLWRVPVTSQGKQSAASAGLLRRQRSRTRRSRENPQDAGADPQAGLWVGSAVINAVSEPANVVNGTNPTPTAQGFSLRLLLHLDNSGQARLLQKVLMMWQNGTYTNTPNGVQVTDQPGTYVLVTDDSLIPQFSGAALRGGQPVARRFSSGSFAFDAPIALAGSGPFGGGNSLFVCTNVLSYTNVLNPFVHQYHPDHDNYDDSHTTLLADGVECPTITRQITLQFTASDPNGLAMSGWGDNQVGGIYSETIIGLYSRPLYVQGTFRLSLTCNVGVLNGGL
ncbi:MAG: hypothetical protein ACLQVX_23585 [Limisphaerales bacterium]